LTLTDDPASAVDGVRVTFAAVGEKSIEIGLIPTTLELFRRGGVAWRGSSWAISDAGLRTPDLGRA
jgi:hypothetical protein